MTDHDPFSESDDAGRTVIRPMPGGRRPMPGAARAAPALSEPAPAAFRAPPSGPLSSAAVGALAGPAAPGANPLTGCAADLLTIASQLRGSPSHSDPAGLRDRLVRQVRDFETCARAKGLGDAEVLPARYVLCALIDEAVLDTPWGSASVWSNQGLLVSFHNETWGGEKFFSALERLLAYPSGNLNLLELMYLCLALGFEGRYRARDDGRSQLERVREQLYHTIRAQRGDPDSELSPHWRGVAPTRDPLIHQLPLWVLSSVAALLLLGLFSFFSFDLNRRSDPVFLALSGLGEGLGAVPDRARVPFLEPPPPAVPDAPAAPAGPTLRGLLADEIAAGRMEVVDRANGETVILRGDGLFASGRSTIAPAYLPRLQRVGEALAQLPGQILVTGHTDSVPIQTLRFPSNWHLSQERAQRVADLLIGIVGDATRFTVEGRADTEPRVPERPTDARNRRVEITLRAVRHRAEPAAVAGVRP